MSFAVPNWTGTKEQLQMQKEIDESFAKSKTEKIEKKNNCSDSIKICFCPSSFIYIYSIAITIAFLYLLFNK